MKNSKPLTTTLTKREIEIILLICKQYNTIEIAEKLGLRKRTIESYRATILQKIKARNTAGVIVYAIKKGIYKIVPARSVI